MARMLEDGTIVPDNISPLIHDMTRGHLKTREESKRDKYVREHFPDVEPGVRPPGARMLVQLRKVKRFTSSGIQLPDSAVEFNDQNTSIGRLIGLGVLAFCNRETGKPWPEGVWAKLGDVILVPSFGGLRFRRPIPGTEKERNGEVIPDSSDMAIFCFFDDYQLQGVVDDLFEDIDKIR